MVISSSGIGICKNSVSFHLVSLVDVVEHDVIVRVDFLDRLVWSVHGEALLVVLGHGTPVCHPTPQKDIINKEIRQLKERF